MRVILASSEVEPYSKTGGLADVAGALPKSLARAGCDISVVTPRYTGLGGQQGDVVSRETGQRIFDDLYVPFAGGVKYASVWRPAAQAASVATSSSSERFGMRGL